MMRETGMRGGQKEKEGDSAANKIPPSLPSLTVCLSVSVLRCRCRHVQERSTETAFTGFVTRLLFITTVILSEIEKEVETWFLHFLSLETASTNFSMHPNHTRIVRQRLSPCRSGIPMPSHHPDRPPAPVHAHMSHPSHGVNRILSRNINGTSKSMRADPSKQPSLHCFSPLFISSLLFHPFILSL